MATGQASWQERRYARGQYAYFNDLIAEAPEFKPREKSVAVDVKLVQFTNNDMYGGQVMAWLEEQQKINPAEYEGWELARPEHLDDMNADPKCAKVLNRNLIAVALGASVKWKSEILVACLRSKWWQGKRELDLQLWTVQWPRGCFFVLVRQSIT